MRPIFLIYPKTNPYPHSISTPLSIFCLGSYLETKGIEVEYFDERISKTAELLAIMQRTNPLMVCISSMTGYQIRRGLEISRLIRKYCSDTPIVWGGVHPTMLPEQTLASPFVDFVVRGEGEETLWELYQKLVGGRNNFQEIAGLSWKKQGQILANPDRGFLDLNQLPFPYVGQALKMLKDKYLKISSSRPVVGYQITRGCVFRCKFCYNSFFSKWTVRTKCPEKYAAELRTLKQIGVEEIFMYDTNLAVSKKFLIDFCVNMRELKMRWHGSLRIDIVDEEVCQALEEGGCSYLLIGIETLDEEKLRGINKGQMAQQITRGITILSQWRRDSSDINKTYSFICGLPGEDTRDVYKIMDFIDELRAADPRAGVAIQPYSPFPGTPLYEEALRRGFVAPRTLEKWWDSTTGDVGRPLDQRKKFVAQHFSRDIFGLSAQEISESEILSIAFNRQAEMEISVFSLLFRTDSLWLDEMLLCFSGPPFQLMEGINMILVTGATGFIGNLLVKQLIQCGHSVRAMVMTRDPLLYRLEGVSCEKVMGDIMDPQTLRACFVGVETVFHLAAVMVSHDPAAFHKVNYNGTSNVVDAAVEAGVKHVICLSAAAANYKNRTKYGDSKLQAEALMKERGQTKFTIVRPTLLYGDGGSQELMMYVNSLRSFPFMVPVIGGGKAKKRPVWVNDVVQGLTQLVNQPISYGKTYNFGGATEVSMWDYTKLICQTFGINKVLIPVPVWPCALLAKLLASLGIKSVLTRDTILGVTMDANGSIEDARRDIGYCPHELDDGYNQAFSQPGLTAKGTG